MTTTEQTMGCTRCDIPTFRPGLCDSCRADADAKQEALSDLLMDLQTALKSRHHTVQVMDDGIEIIHVETGDLERKLMLSEVLPDGSERTDG